MRGGGLASKPCRHEADTRVEMQSLEHCKFPPQRAHIRGRQVVQRPLGGLVYNTIFLTLRIFFIYLWFHSCLACLRPLSDTPVIMGQKPCKFHDIRFMLPVRKSAPRTPQSTAICSPGRYTNKQFCLLTRACKTRKDSLLP